MALRILTGRTPIILEHEELVKQITFRHKQQQQTINLDYVVEYRLWPHPAKSISIIQTVAHVEATICAFNDDRIIKEALGRL